MTNATQTTTKKLISVAVASFGLAFAMVPMYNIACEKIFGIKLDKNAESAAELANSRVDEQREVTVFFDGRVNSKLPWQFGPNQSSITVIPGKMYEASYFAKNVSTRAVVGNAAPSIAPNQYSGFFSKTECFCFTEQALQAGETKTLPVRFMVSADLPKDVKVLTLSYTFFINETASAKLNVQATNATAVAP